MPHMAAKVSAEANGKFADDAFWSEERRAAVIAAKTLPELGEALLLAGESVNWLGNLEQVLPKPVLQGILSGYRAAAEGGEIVQILWVNNRGFRVSVFSSPPTPNDSGAVSIVVHAPDDLEVTPP